MLDFLDTTSHVDLPVGGGPSGFIGQWIAAIRWSLYTDIVPEEFGDDTPKPDNFQQRGSGYWCYYADGATALVASRALGQEYPPSQVWLFEAPIDTVLLPEESKTGFGPSISMECAVRTTQSKKSRHEFQMIALPSAVAAFAQYKGYINYEFDVSEISDRDVVVDDEFAAKYIGGEYFDLEAQENVTIPYTESTLWLRRAKLWADLGEPDPRVYVQKDGGKLSTTSDRLSECLAIAVNTWKTPIWARVAMVADPRVDAVSKKSGNRLTRPALIHIYESEEAARADSNVDETATAAATPVVKPPLPAAWKGLENDWLAQVQSVKAKVGSVPVPVARAKLATMDLEGTIAATVDEALSWWGFV